MSSDTVMASALVDTARAAGMAPSVHNTQPWRWRVYPDHLDLYPERARALPVADPQGRLLLISCGAALHYGQLALAAQGWEPVIERWPGEGELLARVRSGGRIGADDATRHRFQVAKRRRTDRRSVSDQPVPGRALAAIRAAVEEHDVYLHVLRPEQEGELAVAVDRARRDTEADPALQAELASWVGPARPAGAGVPDPAIPRESPHTHVPVRDFGRAGMLPPGSGTDRAASYAVLFGNEDSPAGWFAAGEALAAGWLTAVDEGVALLPFSAVVEAPATRAALLRLLAGLGNPYLAVRLGRPDPDQPDPPATERLPTEQTVEIVAGGPR